MKIHNSRPDPILHSGEWINLVAINRATGYMANQRIQLTDASAVFGSFLHVPLEEMVLRPPNLKVWAERTYDIEYGKTRGQLRDYLIGAEGASLSSDLMIVVFTEWYDHTGRPLPDGLGEAEGRDFGLTGRLAKVTAPNEITKTADGGQALFPIAPGRNTQVLKPSDNLTGPEHYYVHVSGTQSTENPNFDNPQSGSLSGRPGLLTPIKTPLYDEEGDWEGIRNFRRLRTELAAQNGDTSTLLEPVPYYAWHYRPEFQFSRYSLEIDEIYRTSANDDGETGKVPIYDLSSRYLNSSDQMIELFYSLVSANFDRLAPIDGPQELVFSLGNHEIRALLGTNQEITFLNLDHIDRIDPEDLVTLRLYSNQDAGNILWEYAFGNMMIVGVELTQSIQNYWSFEELELDKLTPEESAEKPPRGLYQKVPMIDGKPTTLRIYLREQEQERKYVIRGKIGAQVLEPKEHIVPKNCDWAAQRIGSSTDACRTYDVVVDEEEIKSGKPISLYLEVKEEDGGVYEEAWNLVVPGEQVKKTGSIYFIPLGFCLDESGSYPVHYVCQEQYHRDRVESLIDGAVNYLPLASGGMKVINFEHVPKGETPFEPFSTEFKEHINPPKAGTTEWYKAISDALRYRYAAPYIVKLQEDPSAIFKYVLLNDITERWNTTDRAGAYYPETGIIEMMGSSTTLFTFEAFAHEVLHSVGNDHTNHASSFPGCNPPSVPLAPYDWPIAYGSDPRLHQDLTNNDWLDLARAYQGNDEGYNQVIDNLEAIFNNMDTRRYAIPYAEGKPWSLVEFDIMSYCLGELWTSPHRYRASRTLFIKPK